MFVTNHVLAGALAGFANRRRPVRAFAAGFASHVAMDLSPHAGDCTLTEAEFYTVARRDGLAGLAVLAVVLGAAGRPRTAVLAGIVGAVFLDLDKPVMHFFGVSPFPAWLNRFHGGLQNEAPHRLPHEVAAGSGLAVAVGATVMRGRARSSSPRAA